MKKPIWILSCAVLCVCIVLMVRILLSASSPSTDIIEVLPSAESTTASVSLPEKTEYTHELTYISFDINPGIEFTLDSNMMTLQHTYSTLVFPYMLNGRMYHLTAAQIHIILLKLQKADRYTLLILWAV